MRTLLYTKIIVLFLIFSTYSCSEHSLKIGGIVNNNNNNGNGSLDNPVTAQSDPDMIVIGQRDFGEIFDNGAYPSSSSFLRLRTVLKVGSKFIVNDEVNHRVLIFNNSLSNVASVVIGQESFDQGSSNQKKPAPTASTLSYPDQIASDGTKLVVADANNNRVLVWNSIPTYNNQPADVVIGQADFVSYSANRGLAGPTSSTIYYPTGVLIAGGKLYISDNGNNRVLIYNSVPATSGTAANAVLGQANFTDNSPNRTDINIAPKRSFYGPMHLHSDGTKLCIADYVNSRILVWNTLPAGDVDADVVVGQNLFTDISAATSQSRLKYPAASYLHSDGKLYVSDSWNHRVVWWNSLPGSGSAGNASGVIGQADWVSGSINRGNGDRIPSNNSFNMPYGVLIDGDTIYISDSLNHRILAFDLTQMTGVPSGSTATATLVYGQSDFITNPVNKTPVNKFGFEGAWGFCESSDYFIAGDKSNNRYLVFDQNNPSSGAIAVIGQSSFSERKANQGGAVSGNTLYTESSDSSCVVDDSGHLYISDPSNNRVLVYNSIPTSNNVSADYALGQPDLSTNTPNNGTDNQKLRTPMGLSIYRDKIFVGDYTNNRIMVFDLPISSNHETADMVVGQPDFATVTSGRTALKNNGARTALLHGSNLYVEDTNNNRIMVWTNVLDVNGDLINLTNVSAAIFVGQSDSTSYEQVVSKKRFGSVLRNSQITIIDGYLFVPIRLDNRILGFDLSNLATDMNASYVIGQANFTSAVSMGQPNSDDNSAFKYLQYPISIFADANYVWMTEALSSRLIRIKRSKFWNYVNY